MCAFEAEINFFRFVHFIKQNSLGWFKILKTMIMTSAVEEHCLEINVILYNSV